MPEDSEAVVAGAPCGACRTLRRRCVPGCVFKPYFSAEDFAAVHRFYGASNGTKMLEAIELPEQRRVAAATLIEAGRARVLDPTFGQISYIRILQEVNDKARKQVDEAREEIAREFGALAASEPVDVAAAAPAVRVEARAQVDAALKHAREQDARLLGVRNANEARWRELHPADTGTGKQHAAGNGKGVDVKRHREHTLSEQTMLRRRAAKQRSSRPPGSPDERSHQQMAVAEAEREKALLMRLAAPAKQNGHHIGAQHGETEPPRVPEVCWNGQLHQQMSEAQQLTAAAEVSREAAMRSVQPPAAAPQRLDSAGQHAGTGQPRHAGDAAADGTPGQGSTSVLLEAMMQLAGASDEQQHLVAQAQHAENEHGVSITQRFLQLQELLDMAELARKQEIMKNDVMKEMGQWDAAAGVATEQDVMTMMQQIPANTWQHQDPAPQYAGFRNGPQETPQQMHQTSTVELAQTTGNMSQQFAWSQQYHDPAAVHHASPWQWHHQMAEAHQPAAASASQVASEQDMLLLLQQHHQGAAAELLSASGARQFDNLAAQYDGTELTLGYGHPGMHQQVAATGQVAGVQDVNERQHAAAAVLAEREMMQLAAGQQQRAQNLLEVALGNGHPDGESQATVQELYAILELAGKQETIRKQGVTTGMGQWDAASGVAREQDPEAAWLQEVLEKIEKESSMPDLAKTLGNGHPDGSTQGILQSQEDPSQELFAQAETVRKLEMLMRQVAAAGRAKEQEMITQQTAAAQELFAQTEMDRKLEILMRKVAAAGRAREQEMITQQQLHPVAQQYSGTELDISLGQGHGHPYWHQPTVQQMLQEKQLPTVQEQQLADAVGLARHQPTTALPQQAAAYANGEHGSGAGSTMAFLSPGSAKDAPFVVDQQPQPDRHQMGSSLLVLPTSLSQLHAQASHQQRTDGGGQGLSSDFAAYLHYESLSRHGLAGNGRLQQG